MISGYCWNTLCIFLFQVKCLWWIQNVEIKVREKRRERIGDKYDPALTTPKISPNKKKNNSVKWVTIKSQDSRKKEIRMKHTIKKRKDDCFSRNRMSHLGNRKACWDINNGLDYHPQERICHTSVATGNLFIVLLSLLGQSSGKFWHQRFFLSQ